jgi:hypothetical protein
MEGCVAIWPRECDVKIRVIFEQVTHLHGGRSQPLATQHQGYVGLTRYGS